MPLTYPAKTGAGDFTPVPAGSHIAVCDIVADIGMQPGSALFPKPKPQVYIRWELPNERIEFEKDGKKQIGPAVIGKTYTASMNEKATLRHHLESWRGRGFSDEEAETFDVAAILGKPCTLTVTHSVKDGKTYANVTGVGPLVKGVKASDIKAEIGPVLFTPESTKAIYIQLPKWLRKKVDSQILPEKRVEEPEEEESNTGPGWAEDGTMIDDSDIPF